MNISEIEKKSNFKAIFTHEDTNSDWKGFKYIINIGDYSFVYTRGSAHFTPTRKEGTFEKNKKPENGVSNSNLRGWLHYPTFKGVLFSLLSDMRFGDMSFSDFCDELGCNYDSIKDLSTHRQCEDINRKMKSIFSNEEISYLQEELSDY